MLDMEKSLVLKKQNFVLIPIFIVFTRLKRFTSTHNTLYSLTKAFATVTQPGKTIAAAGGIEKLN